MFKYFLSLKEKHSFYSIYFVLEIKTFGLDSRIPDSMVLLDKLNIELECQIVCSLVFLASNSLRNYGVMEASRGQKQSFPCYNAENLKQIFLYDVWFGRDATTTTSEHIDKM